MDSGRGSQFWCQRASLAGLSPSLSYDEIVLALAPDSRDRLTKCRDLSAQVFAKNET